MNLSTRESILEAARGIAQAHGYGALSFRDLAKLVGVKSASVHYHFPTKGDLGAALAHRYHDDAQSGLAALSRDNRNPRKRLREYVLGFRKALELDNRMCLCGIMAAEYDNLPEMVKSEVAAFADLNISWLTALLDEIDPEGDHAAHASRARAIFAAVGGAQLTARSRNDISAFDDIVESYFSTGLIPA